jgi:hypothetical protein
VFAGEVVLVLGILALAHRVNDAPPPQGRVRLDVVGAVLIAVGLGLAVFGVLRSAEWGWVAPKVGGPSLLGVSPTVWLVISGLLVVWLFLEWETRSVTLAEHPHHPLIQVDVVNGHADVLGAAHARIN